MRTMSREKEYNAEIVELIELHQELRILRIKPDEAVAEFLPGQYVEIGMYPEGDTSAKIIRRQYSIASAPNDPRGFELFIVLVKDGALTSPLWSFKEGSRLWMNPKVKGKFTLEPVEPGKNYIFVATGTGLAPFISMIRANTENPPWKQLAIVHGVRHAKDLGYRQELEQFEAENEQFVYIPCVSRDSDWSGLQGRIPPRLDDGGLEEKLGRKLNPQEDQVLICGNPDMIDDLVKSLQERGFSPHKRKTPGNIHFERYW